MGNVICAKGAGKVRATNVSHRSLEDGSKSINVSKECLQVIGENVKGFSY